MSDVAIRVENLSKMYRIGAQQQRHDTLRDAIVDGISRLKVGRPKVDNLQPSTLQPSTLQSSGRDTDFWALKDVSFEVKAGEVVGVIGRNGAGKSTLLKILSRITEPTEGRAEILGRVGSLLEVGTGFHPELSGRENIFLNGAILGMRRTEIAAKFDEIVAFSEIEKFLDTPVKRYSSGMYVRLAFAVAAHLEPEILLVDEVLAVGDAAFQKKALGKMGDVVQEGRTVLFVSHNMPAIESLCQRAFLLDSGIVAAQGSVANVINGYLALFGTRDSSRYLRTSDVRRSGTGEVRFQRAKVLSASGAETSTIPMGEGIKILMEVLATSRTDAVEFGVSLYDVRGLRLCGLNSRDLNGVVVNMGEGERLLVHCDIPRMNLSPGTYVLHLIMRKPGREVLDHVEQAVAFDVIPVDTYGTGRIPAGSSLIFLEAQWETTNTP